MTDSVTNKIILSADSTCDLDQELKERYHVHYFPLHIILDGKDYKDGIDITPEEIYQKYYDEKILPKTAAVNVAEYIEHFKPWIDEGYEVIHINLGSSLSSAHQNCCIAAEELGHVHVIDSCSLSTGTGLLVIEAAIMAKNGHSASEIASVMETLKPNVRASFVVDTLTYLYRGGRCNAVAAMAGGVLKLHPKIVVENGAMDATKKYRGKINSVIMSYVKDMETDLKAARPDRVFITHSGCDAATVESVRSYLESLGVFHEILETRAGGVVSSHCGPGTLGVLFIAK